MSKLKHFCIGLLLALFVATPIVLSHDQQWELHCDGNTCCTIHKDNGKIGDCYTVEEL